MINARLIIMDEPTSSLAAQDVEALFAAIRRLKQKGVAIIYISHFLEEVRRIADCYAVLRDGNSVAHGSMDNATIGELIRLMVGRSLPDMFPRTPHDRGVCALSVTGLSRPPRVTQVSFELHHGEILGIAGLVGSGRTELLRCLYGLDKAISGSFTVHAKRPLLLTATTPRESLDHGVDFLSEDRKEEGLAVKLPIRDNVSLSSLRRFARGISGVIDFGREKAAVTRTCASLAVRCRHHLQKVNDLSGGNQQKIAFARILTDESDVLLLDEPTRGIDVGSKAEIYRLIGALAAQGKAVLMVSSYLPELFGVCDTLAVMHRGRLSPVLPVGEWTEERVMAWATSGKLGQ